MKPGEAEAAAQPTAARGGRWPALWPIGAEAVPPRFRPHLCPVYRIPGGPLPALRRPGGLEGGG